MTRDQALNLIFHSAAYRSQRSNGERLINRDRATPNAPLLSIENWTDAQIFAALPPEHASRFTARPSFSEALAAQPRTDGALTIAGVVDLDTVMKQDRRPSNGAPRRGTKGK